MCQNQAVFIARSAWFWNIHFFFNTDFVLSIVLFLLCPPKKWHQLFFLAFSIDLASFILMYTKLLKLWWCDQFLHFAFIFHHFWGRLSSFWRPRASMTSHYGVLTIFWLKYLSPKHCGAKNFKKVQPKRKKIVKSNIRIIINHFFFFQHKDI